MSLEGPSGIFSQKALDRLRSPEELDKLFADTTPVGWVALAAVLLLVFSGVIWSFYGVMATKVNGFGMIVDSAGMVNIAHTAGGKVTELWVGTGDRVQKGQVIAIVEQAGTEEEIARAKAELNAISARQEMSAKVAQINSLNDKLLRDSQVLSPHNGIITEQKVNVGDVVAPGTPLFGIRLDQERGDMMALLYIPVLDGKKVQPDMTVQIAPGTVDASEYGSLIGRVTNVSAYPVSAENMYSWVGSKEMTNWMLQRGGGAVMEVRVELIKDPDTKTGYLWSSITGAPDIITPGTACTGSIVVKRQAPITKAFQKMKQWLRSD